MRRLPLFPLPLVLFPGAPVPLHVFEPRYRQMVAHCVEADNRFGLLYHDPDLHGPFEITPGRVGTVAEIVNFQPLPDGRSLILCRGRERFCVEDGIESEAMYFEALAASYDDEAEPAPGIVWRRRKSIALFHRVLDEVIRYREAYPDIDSHAETAFQIAQAIRIDPAWQQRLLEARTEADRLDLLDGVLRSVLEANREAEAEE